MTERKKKKNRFAEILRLQRLPLRMTELERKEIASPFGDTQGRLRSFASLRMIQKKRRSGSCAGSRTLTADRCGGRPPRASGTSREITGEV